MWLNIKLNRSDPFDFISILFSSYSFREAESTNKISKNSFIHTHIQQGGQSEHRSSYKATRASQEPSFSVTPSPVQIKSGLLLSTPRALAATVKSSLYTDKKTRTKISHGTRRRKRRVIRMATIKIKGRIKRKIKSTIITSRARRD